MCDFCALPTFVDFEFQYCKLCVKNTTACIFCYDFGFNIPLTCFEGEVCRKCFASHVIFCDCGAQILRQHANYLPGDNSEAKPKCEKCFEAIAAYCSECGHAEYLENMNSGFCNSCWQEHKPHEIQGKDDPLFERRWGIELECVGEDTVSRKGWKTVHDGSIEPDGMEYNSPIFNGDCSDEIIDFTFEAKSFHTVNSTCGFHLHLESKNMTNNELLLLYSNCKKLEPWFFSVVSPSRKNNKYCKEIPDIISCEQFEDLWYEEKEVNHRKTDKYDSTRYRWINFHSHWYRGTIEIRLYQGTLNPEEIINWVKTWQHIFRLNKEITNIHEALPYDLIHFYENRATEPIITWGS